MRMPASRLPFLFHPLESHVQLKRLFFFNDTPTTEIYTLSLHDALPISFGFRLARRAGRPRRVLARRTPGRQLAAAARSEEHTSELQSQSNLVCRLLLEKKKATSPRATSQLCREGLPQRWR